MQVNLTLHLAVTEESVSTAVEIHSGTSIPMANVVGSALTSPEVAEKANGVLGELLDFAKYVRQGGGGE